MPINHNTLTALRSQSDWKMPPGMTINGGIPLGAQGLYAASAVTLTNGTSAQAPFTSVADTLSLEAKTTYRVKGLLVTTLGTTSHTTSFGIAVSGTTFTNFLLLLSFNSSNGTTVTAQSSRLLESGTAVSVGTSLTGTREVLAIDGILVTNAAGTITPQLTYSADPTGALSLTAGSFFEVYKIGKSTVVGTGLYS